MSRAASQLIAMALVVTGAAEAGAQPSVSAALGSRPDALAGPPYDLPSDEELALRAGAWDLSVALERRGELESARTLLERAWGVDPASYEVTVRGAWLSLLLGDYELAVLRYRRAGSLIGAGPEAQKGQASALTGIGYRELEDDEPAAARERFHEALRLDPEQADATEGLALAPAHRFDPELWGTFVGWSAAGSDAYGGGALIVLPFRLADRYRLRGAYRHLELSRAVTAPTGAGPRAGAGAGSRARFRQDEGYLGLGWERDWFGLEVLGLVLSSSADPLVGGQAARLRLGHRVGVLLEEGALGLDGGLNLQLAPQLFVWPTAWLGLAGGVRVTLDPEGEEVSGLLGASVVSSAVELHLRGHLGVERWPVGLEGPSVLNAAGDLTAGGTVTLLFPLGRHVGLGLEGEVQRLVVDEGVGAHGSGALGLRWSPEL